MRLDFGNIWKQLLEAAPPGPGWHSQRIFPAASCPIRAAVRMPGGVPALLVEVNAISVEKVVEYPSARGFDLFPEMTSPGPHGSVRLCLLLSDPSHLEQFAALVEDVCRHVATAPSEREAVRFLLARLHAWQVFLRQHRDELTIEEQTGLFAELALLRQFSDRLSPLEVLEAWKGPEGGLRDFRFPWCQVEVKASTLAPISSFHVANVDQLADADAVPVVLCIVSLLAAESGVTLVQLVSAVEGIMAVHGPHAQERLAQLLMAAGYLNLHARNYETRRLAVRWTRYFEVREGFPRIVREQLPGGILEATYQVDVNACLPYEIQEEEAMNLMVARGE